LAATIEEFQRYRWSPQTLRSHAEQFDITAFRQQFRQLLHSLGITLGPAEFLASATSSAQATA
jgi:hypothetical protein